MDKIDVVLFRYKKERKLSKEFKKMLWLMSIPIIILLLISFISPFVFATCYAWLIVIPCSVLMLIWAMIIEGKWGTNKWKYKLMNLYQERFKLDQSKLLEIIKDEGLSCQQVYNLLTKRYSRMSQGVDKQTFIITIFSLVIAFTGILASPLQSTNSENYAEYVIYIFIILFFLVPIGYILYKVIVAQSKQYDEKKKDYEYVIGLLEDHLY